ncbi:MAG: SIMPL domain-containing protein, partial [Actinomycetota bacterium]
VLVPGFVEAQESDRTDTVTVAARKSVDIEPDIGTVTLGIRTEDLSAQGATDELIAKARRILDALEAIGFGEDQVSTEDIRLNRTCLRNCREKEDSDDAKVVGYEASATVRVETEELERLGEVIDAGVEAGANSIKGVKFDVKDKTEATKEALRQAMVFATDKARVLAETGGRQLGPALIITEGRTEAPEGVNFAPAALDFIGSKGGGGGSDDNPFPIRPPKLSASARVEVTFALN